eukprot:765504-Hanusia_phi.AAC.7
MIQSHCSVPLPGLTRRAAGSRAGPLRPLSEPLRGTLWMPLEVVGRGVGMTGSATHSGDAGGGGPEKGAMNDGWVLTRGNKGWFPYVNGAWGGVGILQTGRVGGGVGGSEARTESEVEEERA